MQLHLVRPPTDGAAGGVGNTYAISLDGMNEIIY